MEGLLLVLLFFNEVFNRVPPGSKLLVLLFFNTLGRGTSGAPGPLLVLLFFNPRGPQGAPRASLSLAVLQRLRHTRERSRKPLLVLLFFNEYWSQVSSLECCLLVLLFFNAVYTFSERKLALSLAVLQLNDAIEDAPGHVVS